MNKFEKFALAMSVLLIQVRGEDLNNSMIICDDNQQIPVDFIDKVLNSDIHTEQIKMILRMSVLKDVTECPNKYMQRHSGQGDTATSEYVYSSDVYEHAYLVDSYIEGVFHQEHPVMECRYVCTHCNSDNVQVQAWVRPNQGMKYVDEVAEGDMPGWCDDCGLSAVIETAEMNVRHKVVGFQVADDNREGVEQHPHMDTSYSLYSLEQAKAMIDDDNNGDEQWKLVAIWTDDVEEPEFMFEGDPRNPKECTPSDGTIG